MSGCFMSLCLAKRGYKVDIYEERADVRKMRKGSGRSFNITLYTRGILALKKAGLWKDIEKISVLTKGNVAHYLGNRNTYDPYDAHDSEVLYTVHRNNLNSTLLDIVAKNSNIRLHFNTRLISIDKINKKIRLENAISRKNFTKTTDLVVGADGVNSTVRNFIKNKESKKIIKEIEDWGYKEVHVTPMKAEQLKFKPFATHTWPRRNSLFIAFPNPDKSLTLMINLPLVGQNSFASLTTKTLIENFIIKKFPDLIPLIPEIVTSFLKNPTGNFTTILTSPWNYRDFILLIGDAAHGVIPFYGQGVCAALEDCLIVTDLMDRYKDDWSKAFEEFEKARKVDTDTLSILAKENFIELRDKSRSLFYILKDKTDTMLNKLFPKIWLPSLYVLVAHGTMNYDEAYRLHKKRLRLSKLIGLDLIILLATIPWYMAIQIKKLFINLLNSK